jgi:hypothetical protein
MAIVRRLGGADADREAIMTMPSEARYIELITTLRGTTNYLASIPNDETREVRRLETGLKALRAVVRYLQGDVDVLDGFLTRPLAIIENACFDAGRGAKPRLLDHAPERPGKATRTTREAVQGSLVFAVHLFRASGMSTERAVNQVVQQARMLKVRCADGAPITKRQVKNWCGEISRSKRGKDDALAGARETFDGLRHMHAPLLAAVPEEFKPEHFKARATAILKAIAAIEPETAPNQTRRLGQ